MKKQIMNMRAWRSTSSSWRRMIGRILPNYPSRARRKVEGSRICLDFSIRAVIRRRKGMINSRMSRFQLRKEIMKISPRETQ